MIMFRRTLVLLSVLALQIIALPAWAQDEGEEEIDEPEMAQEQDPPKDEKQDPDAPKKNPDVEKYEKAIKDATKYEGAFTLYTRKQDILLELPEDAVGKLFMAQASLNKGFAAYNGQAGEPVGDGPVSIFRIERNEDKLVLKRPRTRFRWDDSDPLAIASDRTFPEAIVTTFRIEQKEPEKKLLLVNVTSFFQGQVFELPRFVGESVGGQASPDREFTKVDTIRNVGDATVVRMDTHFKSQGGGEMEGLLALFGLTSPSHLEDKSSIPFKVTYTLWYRKESDYVPRLADTRVGYFTQDFFSVDRMDETDRTERYIGRFNLKKKDPTLALSEPVKPVVWVIDESVPERYRSGVKQDILAWNKAFEKIGFKDAVRVEDAPAKEANFDHADGLHNVVRWNMSEEMAYAVALFRMDPITGEVLNASVSIDANYAAFVLQDYNFSIKQARPSRAMAERALFRSVPGEPDALRELMTAGSALPEVGFSEKSWMRSHCMYAPQLATDAAVSWAALKASGAKISEDDFMNQFIADLVMHEVGHCFGLRHNFAGSTQLNVSEMLNDDRVKSVGLSASVMDYTPLNTPAILRGNGVFFNTTIGPYDEWAISYGYTPIYAVDPDDEKPMLDLIARRSGEPGHLFMTDEDADGLNPLAVRFDLGSDTIEWLKTQVASSAQVRKYAIQGLTKPGEDYGLRTDLILSSYMRDTSSAIMASRFIGGVEARRNHKGDVGEKPTLAPVNPRMQRQAMKMIIENILMKDRPDIPEDVMKSLSPDPNAGMGGVWNAPMRDMLGGLQILMLSILMSANKVDDIAENDFKSESARDRYTIAEHYNWLYAAVFKEVGTNKNVTAMRRDLQRFMVEGLIRQSSARAGLVSDDLRVVASQGLVRLEKRFKDQVASAKGLDELTLLHYRDIAKRIDGYLNRTIIGDR